MGDVLFQFLLSALAIVIAGMWLVRYSDQISEATKLGKMFVGSILLAGATSLPEFFVDVSAVRRNMPDLAVGDLFGSSIFNLLILAIADLMHRGPSSLFSRVASKHALAGAMSISVTAIAGVAMTLEGKITLFQIGNLGLGTLSILIAFLLGLRITFQNEKIVRTSSEEGPDDLAKVSLAKAITGYVVSAIVILVAAPYLAEASGEIAERSGLGKSFIGTTLVAFSTSLPELVSTITAVRRGAFDLALGNIFGSNTFNMLLLTPLDLIYKESLLASVSSVQIVTCFATILITSVAIMGQLYQAEDRKKFIEPDAFTIIFLVFFTITALYFLDR